MDDLDFSKIYSVSRLKLFEECPKAYHFSFVDEVFVKMKSKLRRDPENIWSFQTLGKAVHDSITLFFYLPEDERNWERLKEQLKIAWRSEAMPNKLPPLGKWGGFKTLEEERETYKQALQLLLQFQKHFAFDQEIEYLPTKNITRSIDDYKKLIQDLNPAVQISGKFDLILKTKQGLAVVDFKTGRSEDQSDFQLKFYKLLAELNFDQPVVKASFYYLKSGHIKEYDLTKDDCTQIKTEILTKIDKIKKTKDFPPRPGKLCRYCLFRNFCPAKKEIAPYLTQPAKGVIDDLPF